MVDWSCLVDNHARGIFTALLEGKPAPISLREGLAMTLPGIYAEESAKRGGEVLRMTYPWDPDFKTTLE